MRTIKLPLAILLASISSHAMAQDDAGRIAALEAKLAAQEASLNELKAELQALRVATATDKKAPDLAPLPAGCSLADEAAVARALADPNAFEGACFFAARADSSAVTEVGSASLAAAALYDNVSSPLPDRALPQAGIVPQMTFGKDARASLKVAFPIVARNCYYESGAAGCDVDSMLGYAPRTITPYVSVATVLSEGVGKFLGTDSDTGDLDISSKASGTVGLEFVQYRRIERADAIKALDAFVKGKLTAACVADRKKPCSRDEALQWLRETDANPSSTSGLALKHAELVKELSTFFWQTRDKLPRPEWGIGASAKFGTRDFGWRPGIASLNPALGQPGPYTLVRDFTQPLGPKVDSTHTDYKIEGHFFHYFANEAGASTPPGFNPGIMLLGQISYLKDWRFAKGTEDVQLCPVVAGQQYLLCDKYNLLAPLKYSTWTGAVEMRADLVNLRWIGTLGFAPRFEYAFDTERKIFELPFYFGSKDSSGGIKFTRAFGGTDLLGQAQDDENAVSIFFTPLKFDGF